MRKTFTPMLLAAALTLVGAPSYSADLQLQVSQLMEARGSLLVAIYPSASSFRKDAIRQVKVPATVGAMVLKFSDLAPGEYAIAVFHDANDNGKLDTNLMGMPKEAYGFSVIEKSLSGPPSWEDVKFTLTNDGASLAISLRI
jgi:uncharacterized protein (DUF2141 family)